MIHLNNHRANNIGACAHIFPFHKLFDVTLPFACSLFAHDLQVPVQDCYFYFEELIKLDIMVNCNADDRFIITNS